MKKLLLACFLLLSIDDLMAQGIEFLRDEPFEKVLALAKEKNKLIFVDGYTQTCAPCKQLDRETFPLQTAGDYFNAGFINVKYDLDKPEGKKLHELYKDVITGYPSLVLIAQDGKMIHKIGGFWPADSLIHKMNAALTQHKSLSEMRARYQSGEKSVEFVREYQQLLKDGYLAGYPGSEGYKVNTGILERLTDEEMLNPAMWSLVGNVVSDPYSPVFARVAKNYFRFQQQHVTDMNRLEYQLRDGLRLAVEDIVKVRDEDDKLVLKQAPDKQAVLMKYLSAGSFIKGAEGIKAELVVHDLALASHWSDMIAAFKWYDAIQAFGMDSRQLMIPYLRYMLQYCKDKRVLIDAAALLQQGKPGGKLPDDVRDALHALYQQAGNKQMAD